MITLYLISLRIARITMAMPRNRLNYHASELLVIACFQTAFPTTEIQTRPNLRPTLPERRIKPWPPDNHRGTNEGRLWCGATSWYFHFSSCQWTWKIRFGGLRGSRDPFLNDGLNNGKCHMLHTNVLIHITSKLKWSLSENSQSLHFCLARLVKSLIPIFDLHKPPHRKTIIKQQPFHSFLRPITFRAKQQMGIRNCKHVGLSTHFTLRAEYTL